MAKTAEQAVQRYLQSTQSGQARQRYLDGIAGTQVNPMEEAAKADQLYLQRVQEAVTSGRRQAALLNTPKSRWTDNATKKGADRLATGAAQAADKVRAHFQKWTPIYQQISQQVQAMPKMTTEDSIARSAATIRAMKQAAGKA